MNSSRKMFKDRFLFDGGLDLLQHRRKRKKTGLITDANHKKEEILGKERTCLKEKGTEISTRRRKKRSSWRGEK